MASAAIGFAVITDLTHAMHVPWRLSPGSYWRTLAAGIAVALLTTIPLLGKFTAPRHGPFRVTPMPRPV